MLRINPIIPIYCQIPADIEGEKISYRETVVKMELADGKKDMKKLSQHIESDVLEEPIDNIIFFK